MPIARKINKSFSLKQIISFVVAIVFLLGTLAIMKRQEIYQILIEATGEPANIVVESAVSLGELNRLWSHLAQGGEDLSTNMLSPVLPSIRNLGPQTIRLDHIYDGYDVVRRDEAGQLEFHWVRLDEIVGSIRASGATPMLALSYMPPAIASSDIVSQPGDWNEWALVVQKTMEHYSGELNIPNVAYEVWNEPDLFGGWKTYGGKNYLELYRYSAIGASRARTNQPFLLGGPAITAAYVNWTKNLLTFVEKNNLRLDFFSWHRYHKNPDQYLNDFQMIATIASRFSRPIPKLFITESGPNSENDPAYDGDFSAAHLAAVTAVLAGKADRIYTFEIVDGKSPNNQDYWGRWGLITHPTAGGRVKPRFQALQMLNSLSGSQLKAAGAGTWVKTLATKKTDGTIQVLIVNCDPLNNHREETPLSITDLTPGVYTLSQTLAGGGTTSENVTVGIIGVYFKKIPMAPNSIVLIELKPT